MNEKAKFMFTLLDCASLLLGSLFACSPKSTTSPPPVSVESQLASEASIYKQSCVTSSCHGTNGEGIRSGNGFSVWPLVGDKFQTRHPNSQITYDVVRSGGESKLRALTDQQIYDAIVYQ